MHADVTHTCAHCHEVITSNPKFTESATYCRTCYYDYTLSKMELSLRIMSALQRSTHPRNYPHIHS
jgi:hypothetical protein